MKVEKTSGTNRQKISRMNKKLIWREGDLTDRNKNLDGEGNQEVY